MNKRQKKLLYLQEILQIKMSTTDISPKIFQKETGYSIVTLIRMINGNTKMPAETLFTLFRLFNIKFKIEVL